MAGELGFGWDYGERAQRALPLDLRNFRPSTKNRRNWVMDLGLDISETNGSTVLAVRGEVDVYTAPRLKEKLVELAAEGHYRVVVDLEHVDFLDSTALGVLVGGLKRLRSHEGDLVLVSTQRRILKVFEITGLTNVFSIYDSVEDATKSNG